MGMSRIEAPHCTLYTVQLTEQNYLTQNVNITEVEKSTLQYKRAGPK